MVKKSGSSGEDYFNEIVSKVSTGVALNDEELNFVNSNSHFPNEVKTQINLVDKQNKGEKLKTQEQKFLDQARKQQEQQMQQGSGSELPLSLESKQNLDRFEQEKHKTKFQINHITDLHATSEEFESILLQNLSNKGHLVQKENGVYEIKDGVAVAITGDVITDFFDRQREGLETFLIENIVNKAKFLKEDEKDFISNYSKLMELAGLDESMIREKNPMLEGENSPLDIFVFGYLFGAQDPHFLNFKQKKEFRNAQKKVQELLKKGMRGHAKREYTKINDILKKYNFTSDQIVMVSGNHDIPDVFNEVLSDYVLTPGQVKNVGGIKFGNIVGSSNGNFTRGQDFNDVFGYSGLREELEDVNFKAEAFVDLQNHLKENGIEFEDRELKKYIDNSIQRAAQGIGTGKLGEYFKKKIEPILQEHVKYRLKEVEKNIPFGADVVLNHSVIDDPQRAGLEEVVAHDLLAKHMKNMLVLGGHEHRQTSHKKEDIYHINPGSVQGGNSAVHLLNEDKSYNSSLFKSLDENNNDIYKHLYQNEIPGQSPGKVK